MYLLLHLHIRYSSFTIILFHIYHYFIKNQNKKSIIIANIITITKQIQSPPFTAHWFHVHHIDNNNNNNYNTINYVTRN